nr:aldo/keto reductase [Nostoc sp. WHI]
MIGLGSYHLGSASGEKEAIKIVRSAVDHGINFMDNCWDYHDGKSEVWMGNSLRDGYRDKVYLMTKIDGRNKETAARQINESLSRLRTDHLDLLQLHEIIRLDDPNRIFAPGGGPSKPWKRRRKQERFVTSVLPAIKALTSI